MNKKTLLMGMFLFFGCVMPSVSEINTQEMEAEKLTDHLISCLINFLKNKKQILSGKKVKELRVELFQIQKKLEDQQAVICLLDKAKEELITSCGIHMEIIGGIVEKNIKHVKGKYSQSSKTKTDLEFQENIAKLFELIQKLLTSCKNGIEKSFVIVALECKLNSIIAKKTYNFLWWEKPKKVSIESSNNSEEIEEEESVEELIERLPHIEEFNLNFERLAEIGMISDEVEESLETYADLLWDFSIKDVGNSKVEEEEKETTQEVIARMKKKLLSIKENLENCLSSEVFWIVYSYVRSMKGMKEEVDKIRREKKKENNEKSDDKSKKERKLKKKKLKKELEKELLERTLKIFAVSKYKVEKKLALKGLFEWALLKVIFCSYKASNKLKA